MVRLQRLIILIVGAGMLVLLVGCGQNATGSSASPPGFVGTPGNAQQVKTAISRTSVPLHPSPIPSVTTLLTGEVTLQIDAVPQHASDTIAVTLHNQTNQVILFSDHLTECTVILLQLKPQSPGSDTWQAVAPCRSQIATRLHTLAPGKQLTVTLIPPGGQWVPGLYRALLSYFVSNSARGSKIVSSPSFQLGT